MVEVGTIIVGHTYSYTPGLRGGECCDTCGCLKAAHRPEEISMGGKPSKGTRKDKRLKANGKPKGKR